MVLSSTKKIFDICFMSENMWIIWFEEEMNGFMEGEVEHDVKIFANRSLFFVHVAVKGFCTIIKFNWWDDYKCKKSTLYNSVN